MTPFCVPADVTTVCRIVYKVVNRSGEEFMDVEDLKWTIGAENCHMHFNNLFGGDKILGKTVVRRVQVFTLSALLPFPQFFTSALPLTTVFVRFCAFYFPHYILFSPGFPLKRQQLHASKHTTLRAL
jgi:hypothetical protein